VTGGVMCRCWTDCRRCAAAATVAVIATALQSDGDCHALDTHRTYVRRNKFRDGFLIDKSASHSWTAAVLTDK